MAVEKTEEKFIAIMSEEENSKTVTQTVDFSVNPDFMKHLPPILSNVEELGKWAIKVTETDRNAIVTEDTINDAKKRRADINHVLETIENERKKVKKAYNAPYADFETKLKKTTETLKKAADNLGDQIKRFAEEKKAKKQSELKDYWNKINVSYARLPYEAIENEKWLNASIKKEQAFSDMDEIYESIRADISVICEYDQEHKELLIDRYFESGRKVAEVMSYSRRLKEIEGQRRAEKDCVDISQREQENTSETKCGAENVVQDEIIVLQMEVECKTSELKGFASYMKAHKIVFRELK